MMNQVFRAVVLISLRATILSLPAPCVAFVPSPPKADGCSRSRRGSLATALSHRRWIENCADRRAFVTPLVAAVAAATQSLFLPTAAWTKSPANAIAPDEASRSYDVYAAGYDGLDGGAAAWWLGIDDTRDRILGVYARGDVLEIGVGTGLNLASYQLGGDGGVRSLMLLDVSEGMLARARERVQRMGIEDDMPVKLVRADASSELASLFGENRFDTVVDTFSLCVMGNEGARRCLDEMTMVVKKGDDGGRILLIENTRSSNPLLGYYQDITASAAADMGGKGCVYNQNVGEMIRQTKGLELVREEVFAAGLFRAFVCKKK